MANLETLELTINANAESARTGIETLIHSLSSLSDALTKPYSDLRDFNAELKKMKEYCQSIKMPNVSKISKASQIVEKAKRDGTHYESKGVNVDAVNRGSPDAVPDDVWQKKYDANVAASLKKHEEFVENLKRYRQRVKEEAKIAKEAAVARGKDAVSMITQSSKIDLMKTKLSEMTNAYLRDAQAGKLNRQQMAERAMQIKDYASKIEKAEKAQNELTEGSKNNASVLGKLKASFKNLTSGISGFFSKIKRIATTMLIRKALRSLVKSVKEGISNLYQWSKLNNGDFAKSLDALKSKTQQLKNSIGASIAPMVQAAIPIIQSLANAAIKAFNAINQLLSLLTGKNSWTKATEVATEYGEAAKEAGGATQDWLASFDELNVMSSGGGGGSGSAAQDYENMFEEITEFDSKIRELADFLKDNAQSIKDLAIATGVAILGWKLGNAFAETLPLLSKIAGLIGVGAVIAITIQADWMLTNEYLNTGNEGWLISSLLTNAVGGTAAYAIAKKLIGGKAGYYAFGFTLLLSALTDIKANVEHTDVEAFSKESLFTNIKAALVGGAGIGFIAYAAGATVAGAITAAGGGALFLFGAAIGLKLLTQKNQIKWGNLNLTEDQINEYVKERMFTAEAFVLVDNINVLLANKNQIETGIRNKISAINSELNVLNLGIDKAGTLTNIAEIIGDENSGLVKDIADLCNVNISMLKLTFSSMTAYDGEGNVITTDSLMTGIRGWATVSETMTKKGKELTDLLIRSAKGELSPEMEAYTQQLLEEVTSMTQKIANAQAFAKTAVQFRTAALDAMNKNSVTGILSAFKTFSSENEATIKQGWTEVAESYVALAEIETDPELKALYLEKAEEIIAGLDKTVAEELKKQNQPGVDLVTEWLKNNVSITKLDGLAYWTGYLNENGFTQENFAFALKSLMMNNGVDKTVIEAMDLIGFSGWDLLSDELKTEFLKNVKITPETIRGLKQIGVEADRLVKVINWESFTTEEKFRFLDSIKRSYGSTEALAAAKAAGIDIKQWIVDGLGSKNEKIRKQAEYWNSLIVSGVEGKQPVVTPKLDYATTKTLADTVKKTFENEKPTIVVNKVEVPQEQKNNVVNEIGGLKPTINVNVKVANDKLNNLKDQIQGINPKITTNVDINKSGIRSSIISALTNIKLSLVSDGTTKDIGNILAKANGGFVDSGDIFIANENGVPEMVGRFGNQTAVANTDQIVAGIASGVSAANQEQNALLRQQNALLAEILQKDNTVRLTASSALGRTVNQSLKMYGVMVGV